MNRVILSTSTDETILAVTRQHKLVDLEKGVILRMPL